MARHYGGRTAAPQKNASSYVYGPVPSRRLGRSLGIDIIPFKTCTYDCSYCQLGATTALTTERREYVPTDKVIDDALAALGAADGVDYVTMAGSGEPTLHTGIGRIIAAVKHATDIPVAVITNGSLLWDDAVAAALETADLVVPSLDAGRPSCFTVVNRPHPSLSFETMLHGLQRFRNRYAGRMWLEVMLVAGLNDAHGDVARIAELAGEIAPDRVQLNTAVRPGGDKKVRPVADHLLHELATMFSVPVDVVRQSVGPAVAGTHAGLTDVRSLLSRRPCSVDDIARGLGVHHNEVIKRVRMMVESGAVRMERRSGTPYYLLTGRDT